ncbi:hypothetical protein KPL71_001681 [Citrus sinensis]|uniref:Uncharacterized protein n=1 Tax=Citrus sinensis TaxID=2711 RepID=A0ACB8NYJ5_CITSI|nr:hypothetical protein KPL71_001681 [Citrus sinensis]
MISAFSTQHKYQSKRDETLLLQTDLSKANTVIPKQIQWKDVNLPEEWILEGAAPPAIPKQLEPNTELQNVTQYSDGKVKLSFRRSTSSRFSDKASCSSIPSLERKFTKIPSVINLPFQPIKSQPRFSTSDIPSTSIRSVDYTTSVPHPIYTSSQHLQSQEEKEPSPPTSPTFSAVAENVINVIEKEFELDKTFLHNDFYSDLNKEKRLWFFKHFLNQRKEIQQTYYEFVNLHKVHILFFDWFEIYYSDNNINYPFKESNPITIRKKVPEWKLLDSDRTIESEHPPLRSVTVDHDEPPVQIRASLYKIPKPNDSEANLSSIIQQNNFCNTNLNTIGKQLTRIENQIQKSTITVPSISPIPTKSDSDKKLKEPIFKCFQVSKTSQKLVQESKSDFAKAIREQLDRIEAASSSSSKVQIALDTPQSSKIGVLEQDQLSIASSDIEAFKEEPSTPKANKIHWELALPTVKTPPDLAIDNRPRLLQQMTMAANAYKTQAGTSNRAISEILIAGFTGQLKGHTANYYRMNKKLHELDLDEEILSKIAPLLVESSDSESSMSGDNDPYQVDELFDSDDSVSSSSESESDSYLKKINVLTKDQETFLELVKHISDPNLQKEYLDKLLKTLDFNKAETSKVPVVKKNSYDLTQILDKKKTKKTVPNIQDLQKEIKEIKCEIRDLKEKQKSDSDTIQLLLQKHLQDNSDNESNPDDGDDIKVENIESVPNDFLFVLKQITTRKYLIKVTLIFSDDFAMDAIALFDTGADLNCIREDIVPKRFHEKTKERLSAANNSKLNVSSKIMPPKKKDKCKAVLKDSESRATSKEPQATPSKDKLLSSAMPIKSWIEMVEEHGAHYKTTSSDDQVKQWMSSITRSPELMLALQNLSQSQIFSKEEKENPISKEISKPSSQNVIISGESSSSQIVLSQPSPSKKTSDWLHTQDSQLILQRTFKVKWWSKFDEQSKLTENLVRDWLSAKSLLQPSITHSKAQQTFLTQKSKAQSLLASAKTEEEYFKAMEQLLASRSKSSVADTSEDEDEDEDEEPFISLGDDNKDDCFGIFSPVKHCK